MLCELLHVFNGTSDFHYSKPTPFELSLQAVGTAIRHILRHIQGLQPALQRLSSHNQYDGEIQPQCHGRGYASRLSRS
jgi:hypothetical protein